MVGFFSCQLFVSVVCESNLAFPNLMLEIQHLTRNASFHITTANPAGEASPEEEEADRTETAEEPRAGSARGEAAVSPSGAEAARTERSAGEVLPGAATVRWADAGVARDGGLC